MMASIWKQPIFSDVFQSISSTVRAEQGHLSIVAIVAGPTSGTGRAWAPRCAGGRDWPGGLPRADGCAPLQQDEHDAVITIRAMATVHAL